MPKKKLVKGAMLKAWYLDSRPRFSRIIIPASAGYHIMNLDEIEDDGYYLVTRIRSPEVFIEELDLVNEPDDLND